ncbi:MAG: ribonuclease P protein component [Balneolaceae bacterium]|nr:MAG: ribonuclease P protein component [Balneolaceae bacterium]
MKRAQNRTDSLKKEATLPRSKILRGKKNFERLFQRSTLLTQSAIQFRYRIYPESSEEFFIAFIAPKRKFKSAVLRNKLKRWLREAYRTHPNPIEEILKERKFGMHAALIMNSLPSGYSQVKEEVITLLEKASHRLENRQPRTEVSTEGGESTQLNRNH